MRRATCIAALLFMVTGCGTVERKNVNGVDCVIAYSGPNKPRAVNCDWNNATPRKGGEQR